MNEVSGGNESFDVIAAFADGEAVDPRALVRALSDADGREHLVDLMVLRSLVTEGVEWPAIRPEPRRRSLAGGRLAIAASLAAVSLLGGYVWGQRSRPSGVDLPASVIAPRESVAPTPTKVIKLENGVDWNERIGG